MGSPVKAQRRDAVDSLVFAGCLAYARVSEGKVETMAAVHLYAAGRFVTLARSFPSKLQRLLRTGFLRRSFLSGIDGVVAPAGNDDRNRYSTERLLLSSTGSQRLHAG